MPKNKFDFKEDIRIYLTKEDIQEALDVIRAGMGKEKKGITPSVKQINSAKYIIDNAFGVGSAENPDKIKAKTVLVLPPKDEDVQRMIDEGKIKPPKGWMKAPTIEEIEKDNPPK